MTSTIRCCDRDRRSEVRSQRNTDHQALATFEFLLLVLSWQAKKVRAGKAAEPAVNGRKVGANVVARRSRVPQVKEPGTARLVGAADQAAEVSSVRRESSRSVLRGPGREKRARMRQPERTTLEALAWRVVDNSAFACLTNVQQTNSR
jgi:hypothetical protein